ncbi:MAG: CBS domain-containing protein [Clostridiales bacterium]|nr:CBS domain-containing protein [Clostridiales bacterium]
MLKVKDLMTKNVEFVMPDATISEVAQIMEQSDVGIVPVCDEEKRLVGVITDRDIVIRNVAKNRGDIKVEEIMSKRITTASPNEDIYNISKKMAKHRIRRIPIVEENNVLVGVVSIGDIAAKTEYNMEIAEALTEISK